MESAGFNFVQSINHNFNTRQTPQPNQWGTGTVRTRAARGAQNHVSFVTRGEMSLGWIIPGGALLFSENMARGTFNVKIHFFHTNNSLKIEKKNG